MNDKPTGSTAFIMENAALRAEIERLRADIALLQRAPVNELWQDNVSLQARLTEAVAFLDGLADKLDATGGNDITTIGLGVAAADCRAMAAKLRGET